MQNEKSTTITYSDKSIKITDAVDVLCNVIYKLLNK